MPLRALAIVAAAMLAGAGGGVGLHFATRPARSAGLALPELHGQAQWAPRRRPAPALSLRDQTGAVVSLASLRGRSVLLTFLDSQCREQCPIEGRQLGTILRRLPAAQRPALVVVSVDQAGDTPKSIRHALAKWRLRGDWATHWLNAPTRAQLAAVWRSYGIRVVPRSNDIVHSLTLYLIDGHGDERAAYLFPFLPGFVQGDLARLAQERE